MREGRIRRRISSAMTSLMRAWVAGSSPLVALTNTELGSTCGRMARYSSRAWAEGITPSTMSASGEGFFEAAGDFDVRGQFESGQIDFVHSRALQHLHDVGAVRPQREPVRPRGPRQRDGQRRAPASAADDGNFLHDFFRAHFESRLGAGHAAARYCRDASR